MSKSVSFCNPMYGAKSDVLENADLLRLIGGYLSETQLLPFILCFKAVRDALKPLNHIVGEKWIRSNIKQFVTSVSMVEWAKSLGCMFRVISFFEFNDLYTYAASNGSVDVLRWLHQKYTPIPKVGYDVCCEAAQNGHLSVLEYLKSLGTIVEWNERVCKYAARGGHIQVLQWLREVLDPPCPWDEWTCKDAAEYGHLHIFQWLRAQDPPCSWSEYTCFHAALYGHLEVLKWLRSQEPPCPWDKQQCINEAIYCNHHDVLEWILSQNEED